MREFSVRMKNRMQFSTCEAPHRPVLANKDAIEILTVSLVKDLLTISEVHQDGSRIYARRTIDLPAATIFMILPQLPSATTDGAFFPALGTAVIFARASGEKLRLRAVGTDTNSGHCHGWIFDAVED